MGAELLFEPTATHSLTHTHTHTDRENESATV